MGSAAAGALGAGMGLYQTIQGAKQARDAKNALENYQRQELTNTADGLQVSTLGSDIQREEQARLSATQIDAASGGGSRGLATSLGRIEAGNQRVNREIGADLDRQQKEIDMIRANDEQRIQSMTEQRQNNDISALSSQYSAGEQMKYSGLGNIVAGTGQAAVGIDNSIREAKGNPTIDQYGNTRPATTTAPIYESPQYGKRTKDINFG